MVHHLPKHPPSDLKRETVVLLHTRPAVGEQLLQTVSHGGLQLRQVGQVWFSAEEGWGEGRGGERKDGGGEGRGEEGWGRGGEGAKGREVEGMGGVKRRGGEGERRGGEGRGRVTYFGVASDTHIGGVLQSKGDQSMHRNSANVCGTRPSDYTVKLSHIGLLQVLLESEERFYNLCMQ